MRGRLGQLVIGIVVAALLPLPGLVGTAAAGDYDDPFFLNWPTFFPAVPGDFTAGTENDCPPGSIHCVDNVIREMERRRVKLECHHDSAFAYLYELTTEEYRRAVEDPNFFEDNAFVNHEDAVFADYYFEAYDDFSKGRIEEVPPAWRIAFHAADAKYVTGMGDILLGMNAHINRDLPFVLHSIGLTKEDGTSRKPDHDKVNEILNAVGKTAMAEAAERYDPTIDDGDVPGTTLDSSVMIGIVQEWREEAWRKAEMLRDAPTLSDKLDVAQVIEDDAASKALLLREAYAYGLLRDSSERDAFCAAHWDD